MADGNKPRWLCQKACRTQPANAVSQSNNFFLGHLHPINIPLYNKSKHLYRSSSQTRQKNIRQKRLLFIYLFRVRFKKQNHSLWIFSGFRKGLKVGMEPSLGSSSGRVMHDQCFISGRNIGWVTQKNICFHYLKKNIFWIKLSKNI